MFFDVNNLFYHVGGVYAFTAGEYVNVSGTTASSASSVINMGVKQDMGIGDGEFIPKVAVYTSTGITSACSSVKINWQFQGSTDSSNWTTYVESGSNSTASYGAGVNILPIDVPKRPAGVALPQYYRLNMVLSGNANGEAMSAGTLIGGLVIQRADNADTLGQYPSGFSVV